MPRFDKIKTLATICECKIVPVFYHSEPETAFSVLKACYSGGIRLFEFTNRGDHAHEVFTALIKRAAKECPEMILGVGSVVDASTAALYIQSGANFVVGPLLNTEIFKICNRRQIPYIPGCATATEIGIAQEYGAEMVKIFPASTAGGPAFVKNILAPMPWTAVMVTGGVEPTLENLSAWFGAGVKSVGMGSNLFPEKEVEAGDWDSIADRCREVINIVSGL